MRHAKWFTDKGPVTSALTAYIHDLYLNLQHSIHYIQFVFIGSVSHINTTDGTDDGSLIICGLTFLVPQLPANNYQKLSEGEGMARLSFLFCVESTEHTSPWVTDNWLFKHTSCFLCPLHKGGADKDNRAASLGPLMKTSVFQTALASHPLSAHKDLLLSQNGPHKDRQLTPYAIMPVQRKNMHSHKFLFYNKDPHHFDFYLKSITHSLTILFVYPFSRNSLHPFPWGVMLLSPSSSFFISPFSTYLPLSGALSLFPYSPAPLLYCPTLLPSSFPPSLILVRRESRSTCLFINVRKGSRWRREKISEEGKGKREEMWQREKGGRSEREREGARQEPFHCASKLMKRLVRCPPRACLGQQRAASHQKWKSHFRFLFSSLACLSARSHTHTNLHICRLQQGHTHTQNSPENRVLFCQSTCIQTSRHSTNARRPSVKMSLQALLNGAFASVFINTLKHLSASCYPAVLFSQEWIK